MHTVDKCALGFILRPVCLQLTSELKNKIAIVSTRHCELHKENLLLFCVLEL